MPGPDTRLNLPKRNTTAFSHSKTIWTEFTTIMAATAATSSATTPISPETHQTTPAQEQTRARTALRKRKLPRCATYADARSRTAHPAGCPHPQKTCLDGKTSRNPALTRRQDRWTRSSRLQNLYPNDAFDPFLLLTCSMQEHARSLATVLSPSCHRAVLTRGFASPVPFFRTALRHPPSSYPARNNA